SSSITVTAQNLSTGGYVAKAAFTGSDGVSATAADSFGFALDAAGGTDVVGSVTIANPTYAAGDNIAMRVGGKDVSYTVTAQDIAAGNTPQDVIATNLKAAIEASGAAVTVAYTSASPGVLAITNTGTTSLSVSGQFTNANAGGLGLLATIDVSTSANAATALTNIETLINTTVDAAAAFGSAQSRIETQATFISNLSDSMKAGIGAMVDANMEEVSARLQALQVQQQLGVQSLSIANQAPQSILSLFR
ncbi:MAG: flagellin, partial [Rhodobacterales bacterium]|nr:flagellin [Rhodobacterales bacterium]